MVHTAVYTEMASLDDLRNLDTQYILNRAAINIGINATYYKSILTFHRKAMASFGTLFSSFVCCTIQTIT